MHDLYVVVTPERVRVRALSVLRGAST
jgi:hypothetical protein